MQKRNMISIIALKFLAIYILFTIYTIPTVATINDEYTFGAHRGASTMAIENTKEAFEIALKDNRYQFIEFDIQFTKDKKIIVLHTNNKYKMPKNFIDVEDMTYNEIQNEFDFKIPLFEEVMNLIDYKKPIEVEIKSHGNPADDKKLVDIVVNHCKLKNKCGHIIISSPSKYVIEYTEEKYPEIKTGRVFWILPQTVIDSDILIQEFYDDIKADVIFLHGNNLVNYETLKFHKPKNKTLAFWYFTDEIYIMDDNFFKIE